MADLKQTLPMRLQEELERLLLRSEKLLVSLPGSMGEALAVTDRRAFVIRENQTGLSPRCDTYVHSLATVTSAEAVLSSTGGYIELKLAEPAADPEHARVYFPSYDLEKFKAAADCIAQTARSWSEQPAGDESVEASAPEGKSCPKCGQPAGYRHTFCASCGVQLRAICSTCNNPSPFGSRYCTACGTELMPFSPECARCGGRIGNWMDYCVWCGAWRGRKCTACNARAAEGAMHCYACGRKLGSDQVPAGAHRRVAFAQERPPEAVQPDDERTPVRPAAEPQTAAEHNARGQQLFESERMQEAITEFRLAVQMEPDNPTYHCNLAVALDETDRDDEALAEYERTLELDPNDATALLSLGYLYNESGDTERARQAWRKVVQVAPDSAEAQEAADNLRHQEQL